MNLGDTLILQQLQANPGQAYITPNGKALYALATETQMLCMTGDFNFMSDEEINNFIINSLK